MRNAEYAGLSDLTTGSWANIQRQLEVAAGRIRDDVEKITTSRILSSGKRVTAIDEKYFISAIDDSGALISKVGVRNLFVSIDERMLTSLITRIYQDGYNFSERIWRAGLDYQVQMKRVIDLGLSQGRDIIDIARDLEVYVRTDKKTVLKRIGDLKRGTAEFAKRIRKNVDYNAVRILRSELYASMQDAAKFSGQFNPGASGWYDWFKTIIEDFDCVCPENEAGSPYRLDDVPGYPHSNCACIIRPRLRDRRQFVDDLSRWSEGESVGYLDDWNQQYFQFV
jgi:hypothetical protein